MSLALLGFATVVTFIMLIMTKRLSPVSVLIGIPIAFGLMGRGWRRLPCFCLGTFR